jgi:Zn-finger protein
VDLGIIRNEKDEHFVLVKKLSLIITESPHKSNGHVKMCRDCGIVCSTTEQLLRHYKEEHKDEVEKKQKIVLPSREDAWVNFDML